MTLYKYLSALNLYEKFYENLNPSFFKPVDRIVSTVIQQYVNKLHTKCIKLIIYVNNFGSCYLSSLSIRNIENVSIRKILPIRFVDKGHSEWLRKFLIIVQSVSNRVSEQPREIPAHSGFLYEKVAVLRAMIKDIAM
jgi:hypothetical protein